MRAFSALALAALLGACSAPNDEGVLDATDTVMTDTDAPATTPTPAATTTSAALSDTDRAALRASLDAQPDAAQARYEFRNPEATLEFFGITPGMSVGEALPGGGWYSKILLPYLGSEGRLVGVNYPDALWSNFSWMTPENLEARKRFPTEWPEQAAAWNTAGADIDAYTFDTLPGDGSLDAFLFIRALHNLNRFEDGAFMAQAANGVYDALKPGGVVGVVQHEAPADADVSWADGTNGYLRRADVVAAFEAAGFVLDGSADINANPADRPTTDDSVWRLKPSRRSPEDDTALRAQLDEIGESNRMTLRFRKPG